VSDRTDLQALPAVAGEVLESLYQHRLLSSHQIHRMHTPGASMRWTREILTGLRRHDLVDFLRAADGGGSVYFLTPKGTDAVELLPARAQPRRKLITPAHAAGPLRAHTLAVNETGIAFLASARERGDEFGTLAWRHEIAHPIGHRRGELLIADALFTYLRYGPDGELIFHYRLLELDRATLPTDTLAAKLARYARLYRYTPTGRKTPGWQARYPVFPGVICVLAGRPQRVLDRRAQTVLALCREDPELTRTPEVEISICLLCELATRGPFAAIWQRPGDERRLDWLGHPARDTSHDGAGQGGQR
jgi:Replication-relaxation